MSPKEKAEEIFDKISWAMVPDGLSVRTPGIIKHAKRCAIICVEQIIPEVTLGVYRENRNHLMQEDYWKEVLEHLKKS